MSYLSDWYAASTACIYRQACSDFCLQNRLFVIPVRTIIVCHDM